MMQAETYTINREQAHKLLDAAGRSSVHCGRQAEHAMIDRFDRFTVEVFPTTCKMFPEGRRTLSANLYRALAVFWLKDNRIKAAASPAKEAI